MAAKKPTQKQIDAKLKEIVEATNAGSFVYTKPEIHDKLIEQGLVEINSNATNADGIATRATTQGIETIMNAQTETASTPAASAKPSYELQKAALPAISGRGRGGSSSYPFDKMEVGDSFFIPATSDMPNPGKSKASIVSNANKAYGEDTGETKVTAKGNTIPVLKYTKQFVMRSRTAEAEKAEGFEAQAGARVYRTA